MKLIVGLGNPGKEYEKTRHNIGFMFMDKYLSAKFSDVSWKEKYNGLFYKDYIGNEQVVFLKPLSYMNSSGSVIKKYLDYFKIDLKDLLVIYDDMDLEIGNFRLRMTGSSAGHNGIKNIIECVGSENFARIKIGISRNNNFDMKDYVLGNLSAKDLETIDKLFDSVISVVDDYFSYDFEELMNKYNRKNR